VGLAVSETDEALEKGEPGNRGRCGARPGPAARRPRYQREGLPFFLMQLAQTPNSWCT
jgi:hypothetical protein